MKIRVSFSDGCRTTVICLASLFRQNLCSGCLNVDRLADDDLSLVVVVVLAVVVWSRLLLMVTLITCSIFFPFV